MRKLLIAALTAVVLLPWGVRAQSETSADVADGDDEGLVPLPSTIAEEDEAPAAGQRSEAAGSAHTVERGDTLWDLSQKYLGSPWYWPKVWSFNPEIANPHWIYPGNIVRFFSTGEEVPTQVEVGEEQVAEVEEGEFIAEDRVQVAGKIGYVPKNTITIAANAFVTVREVEDSGRITGALGESDMLSFPQKLYAQIRSGQDGRVGRDFIVFRSAGEITHPVTKSVIGYLTKIVGHAKVIRAAENGAVTLEIGKQYDEIARGDYLGPGGQPTLVHVAPRANDRDISDAYVVTANPTFLTNMAEHSTLIIDRGAEDGVKVGNTFTIWRQNDLGDPNVLMRPTLIDERFPREDVATCMAYDVKANASTCLIVQSLREVVSGDHVVMRAQGARSAAR